MELSMDKYHRAIQLLKDMEWCGLHTDYEDSWGVMTRACPCCMNAMKDGHKCGCQLAELSMETNITNITHASIDPLDFSDFFERIVDQKKFISFLHNHALLCKNYTDYNIKIRGGSIGIGVTIRCKYCNKYEDISNYENW